jgi:hypothetical protein
VGQVKKTDPGAGLTAGDVMGQKKNNFNTKTKISPDGLTKQ